MSELEKPSNPETEPTETHQRPSTVAEKEDFSSGGNRQMILLRGKWGLAIDTAILCATGYSLMTKQYAVASGQTYQSTLLLTTIGAKTGLARRAGLPFFEVDGDLIVRGSNGGGPTDPHWVHNVRANPEARIRVRRKNSRVLAHVAKGEERERLFKILSKMSVTAEGYQQMCAPRELPLVVLRPQPEEPRA